MKPKGKYIKIGDNYWSADKYTAKEALAMSKTLKDCEDCLDCQNCEGCFECTNCVNCRDCEYCVNCRDCTDCKNGDGWKNVHDKQV